MKRLLVIALLVWAAAFRAGAQMPDIYEQLKAHPEYLDGTDFLCPTGPAVLTKAPKGYKPFYISHYGRHGALYAWQSDLYDRLNEVLSSAAAEGNLTPLRHDHVVILHGPQGTQSQAGHLREFRHQFPAGHPGAAVHGRGQGPARQGAVGFHVLSVFLRRRNGQPRHPPGLQAHRGRHHRLCR